MADMGERMAKVEGWIDGHEKLCAERYLGLHKTMTGVGDAVSNQNRVLLALAGTVALIGVSLIAWLGVQVYDTQTARIDRAEAARGVEP